MKWGTYVGSAMRLARGYVRTRTKRRRRNESRTLTNQKDTWVMYRKKRMPRRQKRRWRKFTRRTQAVIQKSLGLKQMVNAKFGSLVSSRGQQNAVDFALYSNRGSPASNRCQLDLKRVQELTDPTALQGKIQFQSAQLDITIRNTSDHVVEMDLYYLNCTKTTPDSTATDNVIDMWSRALNDADVLPGSLAPMSYNDLGVTPFNAALMCRYWKVRKVERIYLGSGNVMSKVIRDARNLTWQFNDTIRDSDQFGVPKMTQVLLVVFKGAPGTDGLGLTAALESVIEWNVQTKYGWTVLENNHHANGLP